MNITLHIEAVSPAELQEAIAGLAGITGGTTPIQPEKPKSPARTKVEKQPDTKSEEPTKQEEPTNDSTEDASDEAIPTVVELRAAAQEKGKTAEGKRAIKALLDEFGSKSISDVPENVRAEFMRRLEAL